MTWIDSPHPVIVPRLFLDTIRKLQETFPELLIDVGLHNSSNPSMSVLPSLNSCKAFRAISSTDS